MASRISNPFSRPKFSKANALKAGLLTAAAAGTLHAAKGPAGVFEDLPSGPARTALTQNNQTAERVETSVDKFVGEFYLDRLVNNGLTSQYSARELKSVAIKQYAETKKFLSAQGEFTIKSFRDMPGNPELAKSLADIERTELQAPVLAAHTEAFFADPATRQQIQDKLQAQSIARGWQAPGDRLSQYNFSAAETQDARGMFADMGTESPEPGRKATAPATPDSTPAAEQELTSESSGESRTWGWWTLGAATLAAGAYAVRRRLSQPKPATQRTRPGWTKSKFLALEFPTFRAWGRAAKQALSRPASRPATVNTPPVTPITAPNLDVDKFFVEPTPTVLLDPTLQFLQHDYRTTPQYTTSQLTYLLDNLPAPKIDESSPEFIGPRPQVGPGLEHRNQFGPALDSLAKIAHEATRQRQQVRHSQTLRIAFGVAAATATQALADHRARQVDNNRARQNIYAQQAALQEYLHQLAASIRTVNATAKQVQIAEHHDILATQDPANPIQTPQTLSQTTLDQVTRGHDLLDNSGVLPAADQADLREQLQTAVTNQDAADIEYVLESIEHQVAHEQALATRVQAGYTTLDTARDFLDQDDPGQYADFKEQLQEAVDARDESEIDDVLSAIQERTTELRLAAEHDAYQARFASLAADVRSLLATGIDTLTDEEYHEYAQELSSYLAASDDPGTLDDLDSLHTALTHDLQVRVSRPTVQPSIDPKPPTPVAKLQSLKSQTIRERREDIRTLATKLYIALDSLDPVLDHAVAVDMRYSIDLAVELGDLERLRTLQDTLATHLRQPPTQD